MGGTSWSYVVPYRESLADALESLQGEVFRARSYRDPRAVARKLLEQPFLGYPDPDLGYGPDGGTLATMRAELERTAAEPDPRSIDELRTLCGSAGTHSILDIDGVSARRRAFRVTPLSARHHREFFGSTKPTAEQARGELRKIVERCERWHGVVFVVHAGTKPDGIVFVGVTGD